MTNLFDGCFLNCTLNRRIVNKGNDRTQFFSFVIFKTIAFRLNFFTLG